MRFIWQSCKLAGTQARVDWVTELFLCTGNLGIAAAVSVRIGDYFHFYIFFGT